MREERWLRVFENRMLRMIFGPKRYEVTGEGRSTGLFISPAGISELDCATTKTETAERSISMGRESFKVFFLY